jgi:hypothetical protein
MISAVLPENLDLVWKQVEPLLAKGLQLDHFHPIDMYAKILSGELQLWIGYEDDEIHSAGLTRIYDTALSRVLSIEVVGGTRYDEWEGEALEKTTRFAKDNKCNKVEIHGRRGFGRRNRLKDFKEAYTVFEKDI